MGGGDTGDFDFTTWLGESRVQSDDGMALDPAGVDAKLAAMAADARIARLAEAARLGKDPEPSPVAEPPATDFLAEPRPRSADFLAEPGAPSSRGADFLTEPLAGGADFLAEPGAPLSRPADVPDEPPPATTRWPASGGPVPGGGDFIAPRSGSPLVGDVDMLWANLPSASPPTTRRSPEPKQATPKQATPKQAAAPPAAKREPEPEPEPTTPPLQAWAESEEAPAQRQAGAVPPGAVDLSIPRVVQEKGRSGREPRAAKRTRTREAQPQASPKPAPATRTQPKQSGRGIDLSLLVGVAIFVIGIGALAAWWVIGQPEATDTSSTVGEVTLNVARCDQDGATAVVVNIGSAARQFDATVTFGAGDTLLYPVVIPLALDSGAQQTLQIPFSGNLEGDQTLVCSGSLSNVQTPG